MSNIADRRPRRVLAAGRFGLVAVLAGGATTLQAQEAVRNSLASAEAAAARRKSISTEDYSIRIDPVAMSFGASVGSEYVDNVFLSSQNLQDDFIFRPQVSGKMFWPISGQNSLTLGVGVGYEYYVNTEAYRRFFITPGSDISFDVYVKDFVINLHSQFQLTQDPTSDPTVSGRGSLNRFENKTGAQADWDLNKLLLSFNYDHLFGLYTESSQSYLDYNADQLSLRGATRVHPAMLVGVELGGGFFDYNEAVLNDNTHFSAGPFARWQLSQFTSLRASLGYVLYLFSPGQAYGQLPDFDALYADLTAQQRLTGHISHSLSGGREAQVDVRGTPIDLYYVRYQIFLDIIRNASFGLGISYENGTESFGLEEHLDRIGTNVSASYRFNRRLSASLRYQYYWKDSNIPSFDYTLNRVALEAAYRF